MKAVHTISHSHLCIGRRGIMAFTTYKVVSARHLWPGFPLIDIFGKPMPFIDHSREPMLVDGKSHKTDSFRTEQHIQ